jgi:CRISPR/Cas system-associated endonuclease/helicase Cas3
MGRIYTTEQVRNIWNGEIPKLTEIIHANGHENGRLKIIERIRELREIAEAAKISEQVAEFFHDDHAKELEVEELKRIRSKEADLKKKLFAPSEEPKKEKVEKEKKERKEVDDSVTKEIMAFLIAHESMSELEAREFLKTKGKHFPTLLKAGLSHEGALKFIRNQK